MRVSERCLRQQLREEQSSVAITSNDSVLRVPSSG